MHHTLAYSGILWPTLAYSCILWHTLACSGILWHNQCIIFTADGAYHCPVGSIWLFLTFQYLMWRRRVFSVILDINKDLFTGDCKGEISLSIFKPHCWHLANPHLCVEGNISSDFSALRLVLKTGFVAYFAQNFPSATWDEVKICLEFDKIRHLLRRVSI